MSKGLSYKKLDLHVHTPASADFEDKSVTAKQIVEKAVSAGLDAIAVTDHNTGEWIDKVKEAAKGTKLKVFPGVEINMTGGKGGVHILALFDRKKNTHHIVSLLGSLGFKPDDIGKCDAIGDKSIVEAIKTISGEQYGGIPVLAHANSTKGVLCDKSGVDREQIIAMDELLAVEATDFDNEDKKKENKRVVDLLDGKDPVYKKKMAVYQASDNSGKKDGEHGLDGIGSRFTYFKADEDFDLDSLYQCFIDPEVRIRQMDELCVDCYPRIVSLEVSQGFLGGQKIEFHAGLNSIFGSKGVGKSLIIEFLRFVLDQVSLNPSIKSDTEGKLFKRLEALGKVTAVIELDSGSKYKIIRTFDESDGSPIVCEETESGEEYQGEIGKLFPVLAYSQTEVIKIAEDENAQLSLIDKFIDHSTFNDRAKKSNESLDDNDKLLAGSMKANFEIVSLKKEVSTLAEQLKNIDKKLKNKLFDEFKELEAKKNKAEILIKHYQTIIDKFSGFKTVLAKETVPDLTDEEKKDAFLFDLSKNVAASHDGADKALDKVKEKLQADKDAMSKKLAEWMKAYDKKKAEYDKLLEESEGGKKSLEVKRKKLEKKRQEKEAELKGCEKSVKEFGTLRKERNRILDELDKAMNEHFDARKSKYDELSKFSEGKILLSIEHGTNRKRFYEALKAFKKGSNLRDADIEKICEKITPREFVDALIDGKADFITKKSAVVEDNAKRLFDVLNAKENLAEVLGLQHNHYPEDSPSIKFKKSDGQYEPLSELSVGQKCTALLIIALAEGSMPIVIDQPEDSLDLLSVYTDIVLKLRERKEHRQFILTTHNSNVAVASDSDKYILVDSTANKGQVKLVGTIDSKKMRDEIIDSLEGGEAPHHLKIKKYKTKH